MSADAILLEAGGLIPSKSKADANTTEQVVARDYRHPALGERPVIRLASDRLGEAEDLAMEFLGFQAPTVSRPVAIQQRRSLGFAAWALVNDPANARYALDLVKRMKAAARKAASKPGHAWDAYTEMADDLGRSARHFLPPFWEEAGRAFKDLGNQTYAGRALTKSLEAERVHALPADRARRRDVILEFVLAGCIAGSALSEYGKDLQSQYSPEEAFALFRDLCARRTRGGMAPWATMPKDLCKLAKAAGLDGDVELEKWLEEVIDATAMGRATHQFWKTCSAHCKRIVARSPAFAVALLRHTRPEGRFYGESKLGPWFELLEEWGVLDYLWDDEHRGAPPLGEPIAEWFGRVVRDDVPAPARTLQLLERLAPRLRKEGVPLPLSTLKLYGFVPIDVDVLEACLVLGVKVADPPAHVSITFLGWLSANVDHPFRNQDLVESPKDARFQSALSKALAEALTCHGGPIQRRYGEPAIQQRAFPLASGNRTGINALWHRYMSRILADMEDSGLTSFKYALKQLESTLWPEALRRFPDLAERLQKLDPIATLERTLRAGVFDEYGLPPLEDVVEKQKIDVGNFHDDARIFVTFPHIIASNKTHAYVIASNGTVREHEVRLPKITLTCVFVVVGDDLAVIYRDTTYQGKFFWVSDPAKTYELDFYGYFDAAWVATVLDDGGVFFGKQAVHPGDEQLPQPQHYFHDGTRFWCAPRDFSQASNDGFGKLSEVDPRTGRLSRASVPPWFEDTEGGTVVVGASTLLPAPPDTGESPLGTKDGMLGWKAIQRGDGTYFGVGIDGRRWDKPLRDSEDASNIPVALLRQPGTNESLPVTSAADHHSSYRLWDPSGSTIVAELKSSSRADAGGQVTVLPLLFWHLLKVRDEASSRQLRSISRDDCTKLFTAAAVDRERAQAARSAGTKEPEENPLTSLLPTVAELLPSAPKRLALGIARVVEEAEQAAAAFIALRDKAISASTTETTSEAIINRTKSDLAAAQWGLEQIFVRGEEESVSISAHLHAVAEFLKGHADAGDLPETRFLWFPMLEALPLRCWKTYWRVVATKLTQTGQDQVPWLEFLVMWQELGIGALPGRFDVMNAHPEGAKKASWGGYDIRATNRKPVGIKNGEDRFIVLENSTYQNSDLPYQILRYSTAKSPGTPPGYVVKNVRRITLEDHRSDIAAFIEAAQSSNKPPLPTRQELEETARAIAVSPAEVGLIWMGALKVDSYENNFLPTELRTALGLKVADANVGKQALRNLEPALLEQLCEAVVSRGCAAPFADDRKPLLNLVEETWRQKTPKRLQLDAALQRRLSKLDTSGYWRHVDHTRLLAVAADPARHPDLQPKEIRIGVEKSRIHERLSLLVGKKEPVVDAVILRSLVRLVALIHGETPSGHPARTAMPAVIAQTTQVLEHPGTLLRLGSVHLFEDGHRKTLKPTEWLNQHIGKTKPNASEGIVTVDDGLVVAAGLESQDAVLLAFRPAEFKDEGDLARLCGLVPMEAGVPSDTPGMRISVVVTIKGAGFQKLARAVLCEAVPHGHWPQSPVHTALEVVQEIQKKYNLGEDAAILYAQLLALPDPTAANLRIWNGWTAARLKQASSALAAQNLVLEATRARAGRSFFLPGEWLELKAPWLPIERWKLAHLVDLDVKPPELFPAGGPLVLRPFEDLFAAAWQRVLDGDVPRYEEVKRKTKTK